MNIVPTLVATTSMLSTTCTVNSSVVVLQTVTNRHSLDESTEIILYISSRRVSLCFQSASVFQPFGGDRLVKITLTASFLLKFPPEPPSVSAGIRPQRVKPAQCPSSLVEVIIVRHVGENIQKNKERKKNPPLAKNLPEVTASPAESFIPNKSGRLAQPLLRVTQRHQS